MVISASDSDRAVRRGAGLIINQRDFEGFEEKTRHGTDRDVENLTKTLDKFGCQMREEKNLEEADNTIRQLEDRLSSKVVSIIDLHFHFHGEMLCRDSS